MRPLPFTEEWWKIVSIPLGPKALEQKRRARLAMITARTSRGISIHQGLSSSPVKVDTLKIAKGKSWLVFLCFVVLGRGYLWYGQDPDSVEPEDPCDEDFMKEISS